MAKKSKVEQQAEELGILGIDFSNLTLAKLAEWAAFLAALLNSLKPKAQEGLVEGCCDHKACCHETACLAFKTFQSALKHCEECCDEEEKPEPEPDEGGGDEEAAKAK